MNNVAALSTSFTGRQLELIRHTVAKDCGPDEFNLFIAVAQRAMLDPFRKQISALVFNKNKPDKRRMSIITNIDGLRAIAARSGRYRPDENEPQITYLPDMKGATNPLGIEKAVVRIFLRDDGGSEWRPVAGVAHWDEFAPISEEWKEGDDGKRRPSGKMVLDTGGNWGRMGRVMISKCFDEETEVLTSSGFQRFSEITAPIMQVTLGGLEPVAAIAFAQPYSGPMVTLDSDDLNFCVTPNHDMVTTAGKIEAGAMYDAARSRPAHFIPRVAPARALDAEITDDAIRLAAAYLADGSDSSASGFRIAVSRPRKIASLRVIGLQHAESMKRDGGRVADVVGRQITTAADKVAFSYKFSATAGLVMAGKAVDLSLLGSLSQRQARLFVDTLVEFDGHAARSGVRRFYASRAEIMAAFELAAVAGGYSVSNRKQRTSGIGTKPNLYVTISDRDAIAVRRRGDGGTGLELQPNSGGEVWCVTVPSGQIVVRRNGFSMICGNCAEAQALRKAFPEDLSGLYEGAEMDQARATDLTPTEIIEATATQDRLEKIGASGAITFQLSPASPLEPIALGKIADRVLDAYRDFDLTQARWFESANRSSLQEFWARAKADALGLKAEMDKLRAKLELA